MHTTDQLRGYEQVRPSDVQIAVPGLRATDDGTGPGLIPDVVKPAAGWTGLVERDAERDLIERALTGCVLGRGRLVLLYGQAGAGRSGLLRASVREAETRGIAVLEASGNELERSYGFGIVRQLLEARIARLTPAQRRSILADAGGAGEAALGIGPSEPRASSASFDQIEGVHRLVTRLASLKPLVVVVDDLQWCDRPSLDFLCFLGHRVTRLPVTIIAGWRRGEPSVRAGRLQTLAGQPETVFLTLAPLSHDGVRAVLRAGDGADPDDEIVDVVHSQTGGQPFLVSELAAGLRLRGMSAQADSREAIEALTPESVRRNVVARLGRHSETVRRFAHAVAVLGDSPLMHAADLAGIEPERARVVADALVRAGILRDDATLAFAQPLVRAAVYDTLTSLECAELHQRAAALLCDTAPGSEPTDLERVARHLLRCEPAGEARFGAVLRAVALRAAGRGALSDARLMLERALGEIGDAPGRGEALRQLAEIELHSGELPAATVHAAEARSLASTPSERVNASLAGAEAAAAAMDCEAAVELLESEIRHVGDVDPGLELCLRAAAATLQACAHTCSFATAEAMAAAEAMPGDTPGEQGMLAACAAEMTVTGAGDAARVSAACARALGDGPRQSAPEFSDTADYLACRAALLADTHELVEGVLARSTPPDTAAIDDRGLSALVLRSQVALARGDLAGGEADARVAMDLLGARSPTALRRRMRRDLLAELVVVAIERARPDEAERSLTELSVTDDAPHPAIGPLRIALALAQGTPDVALTLAADAGDAPAGILAHGVSWRPWAALAHHAAGDGSVALSLAAAHLEHARAWASPSSLGHALVARSIVDPGTERLALLEEAVAILESTSARLELARATIELGAALRRARRRRESREQLVRGADLAHGCGADALAARARAELVSVGARPRRAAFSGVAALTASELRVAQLAASGLRNREIATELVVSAKTVSGQLTSVYRKLDVHDRAALAVAMTMASTGDRASKT